MTEVWTNIDKDNRIEEIAQIILLELQEDTSSESTKSIFAKSISQLADVKFIKRMLNDVDSASKRGACDIEKKDVVKGLIFITWLQRLYSTIRSLLLAMVAACIFLPIILYFGSLTLVQNIIITIPIFITGLVVTRLLDAQIIITTKKTIKFLSRHKKLRNIVMDNF
ncbi:MAG TPA: hypothetical protein VFC84_19045 [Desulfosporosinus sp.]|nr:hypothetical protein [Desulfosporosinus sp.]